VPKIPRVQIINGLGIYDWWIRAITVKKNIDGSLELVPSSAMELPIARMYDQEEKGFFVVSNMYRQMFASYRRYTSASSTLAVTVMTPHKRRTKDLARLLYTIRLAFVSQNHFVSAKESELCVEKHGDFGLPQLFQPGLGAALSYLGPDRQPSYVKWERDFMPRMMAAPQQYLDC
jgi:hypothetical protein